MRASLWLGAGGLVAVVIAAGVAWHGWGGVSDVPVEVVRPGPFVRTVIADGNLEAVNATPVTAPLEAQGPMRVAWMVPDGSHVADGEVLLRFDPSDMEKMKFEGEVDRETALSRIESLRAETDGSSRNLDRDAALARRELELSTQFQSKDPEIFSKHERIQSEIDQDLARRRAETSDAVRGIKKRVSKANLDLLEVDKRKADLRIGQAAKGLGALEVRAPHDGIVVYKRDWRGQTTKVGDTVWPGEPVAEIPDLAAMQAKVYVLEADAGGLAAGQAASVSLEAHPGVSRSATVRKVANLARPRSGGAPVQYFEVVLGFETTEPAIMKPGQRVRATLRLDETASALSIPRGAVVEKDGKKVVYRRQGRSFEPVPVTLGPAAVGRVVVESGLSDGDVVALRDPTRPEGPAGSQDEPAPETPGGGR